MRVKQKIKNVANKVKAFDSSNILCDMIYEE